VKGRTQLFNLTFWIEYEPSKHLDLEEEEEVFCLALKNIKSEHWNQDWFWIRLTASIMLGEHSGQKCFSKWQRGVLSTHSTPYIGKENPPNLKCFSPALKRLVLRLYLRFVQIWIFFFAKIECGLYFLDRFDVLMSKMIFKK